MEVHSSLALQLSVAAGLSLLTVIIHMAGIAALLLLMRLHNERFNFKTAILDDLLVIVFAVFGITVLHVVEMAAYAALYQWLGALPDFESAFYFSTTAYTTLGFGDLLLDREWRIIAGIEAINGLLLIGWSTAFFMGVVARMRSLEGRMFVASGPTARPHDPAGLATAGQPARTPDLPN